MSRDNFHINAGEFVIKPTESEKLLGCHVNQSLKWNDHLMDSKTSMVRQLNMRNNALKRVCANAPFSARLMLANGIFQSKLVYLNNVWGGAPVYLLKALQVQQMVAARTVCGFQCIRWSRTHILKTVGWLSVRQLIEFHGVLQVHKTLGSGYPRLLYEEFNFDHPYKQEVQHKRMLYCQLRCHLSRLLNIEQ